MVVLVEGKEYSNLYSPLCDPGPPVHELGPTALAFVCELGRRSPYIHVKPDEGREPRRSPRSDETKSARL